MRGFLLVGLAGLLATSCAGMHGTTSHASSAEEAPPTIAFVHQGCPMLRFEWYGWHHAMLCKPAPRLPDRGPSEPILWLGSVNGCQVYDFEYYGYRPFVRCDTPQPPGARSPATEPIEHLGHVAGWKLSRVEYYGWHAFATYDGLPDDRGRMTEPVELLFDDGTCRAWAFEYYGPHTLTVCDERPARQPSASRLDQPVQTAFRRQGCSGHLFEYYGWHEYLRCGGAVTAFVSNRLPCGQNCIRDVSVQTLQPSMRDTAQ